MSGLELLEVGDYHDIERHSLMLCHFQPLAAGNLKAKGAYGQQGQSRALEYRVSIESRLHSSYTLCHSLNFLIDFIY